jgi:hypothetical protein
MSECWILLARENLGVEWREPEVREGTLIQGSVDVEEKNS